MKLISSYTCRYGNERRVYQESRNSFVIEGRSHYMRYASDSTGALRMADFEGGPYIEVGMPAGLVTNTRATRKIVSIQAIDTGDPQMGSIRFEVA